MSRIFGPAGPKSNACFGPRTKSAARFCPTHPVLVRPGLAVAVTYIEHRESLSRVSGFSSLPLLLLETERETIFLIKYR